MPKQPKIYTIEKTTQRGKTYIKSGTLQELVQCFSYTLLKGNSWDSKINKEPKTIKSLISNLSKSVDVTQGSCYNRDYYELIDKMQEVYV